MIGCQSSTGVRLRYCICIQSVAACEAGASFVSSRTLCSNRWHWHPDLIRQYGQSRDLRAIAASSFDAVTPPRFAPVEQSARASDFPPAMAGWIKSSQAGRWSAPCALRAWSSGHVGESGRGQWSHRCLPRPLGVPVPELVTSLGPAPAAMASQSNGAPTCCQRAAPGSKQPAPSRVPVVAGISGAFAATPASPHLVSTRVSQSEPPAPQPPCPKGNDRIGCVPDAQTLAWFRNP